MSRREEYGRSMHNGQSHVWTGVFLLLVGVAALLKASDIFLPYWLFTWQTFLIALGVFLGLKHNFRGSAWFILIVLGSVFLLRDVYPELAIRRFIWPSALIFLGAYLILRPRRSRPLNTDKGNDETFLEEKETWSKDDFVSSTSFFGGCKKNIVSKNFQGGDIVNVFGGTELNLSQSDIAGRVPLEMTTIFGGTKLIVPPNWGVQSEAVTIFGGLEDKRPASPESTDKILVLKGTVIFGGIEIKSY
jgi:predicted membrane protein